ncbi:uncharacterized protein LY89DRAFT_114090 [Mollisia scopiformis]|uniref:Uncharacterized protein n=1 Tax=Mollisia scopiformis TaxID=149040 RepID=A0A194X6P7_MOLSC|nr:uncharacterized protein LY89DRAFT_114090 [Mollisia scopiformis]KUJ15477.1 hypothetical protein LY89DRAFT_114090 [Mollisia scopiformis]
MQILGQRGDIRQPVDDALLRDLLNTKYIIYLEQWEGQRVFRDMVEKTISRHIDFSSTRMTKTVA